MFLVLFGNPSASLIQQNLFHNFESKCVEDIYFLVDFVARNSNNLQKLGLERKINWALNVFTLGRTAQATIVVDKKMNLIYYG